MRSPTLALLLFVLVPFAGRSTGVPELIFEDGFEWGSECAWSSDTWHVDLDSDDYGDENDPGSPSECVPPGSHVSNALDCDDLDDQVNPEAAEVCNAIDDDCDALLDGQDEVVDRPFCELQEGVCGGSVKPSVLCETGFWNACGAAEYAAHSPAYELSESLCDGLDNDCDGAIDAEDPDTDPSPEVCNGTDDDCDTLVDAADPTLFRPLCENQSGVCAGSTKRALLCVDGGWQSCVAADYELHDPSYEPTETLCDGFDNDCDLAVDEGCIVGGSRDSPSDAESYLRVNEK